MVCALSSAAVDEIPFAFQNTDATCNSGVATVVFSVTNTGDKDLEDFPGQPEFGMTVYSTKGAQISVLSISSGSAGPGQIPGASPLGGSGTASLAIPVGGTDFVTVKLGFPAGLGSVGSLYFDRKVWADINPRNGQINTGELYEFLPTRRTRRRCRAIRQWIRTGSWASRSICPSSTSWATMTRARRGSKCRRSVRCR